MKEGTESIVSVGRRRKAMALGLGALGAVAVSPMAGAQTDPNVDAQACRTSASEPTYSVQMVFAGGSAVCPTNDQLPLEDWLFVSSYDAVITLQEWSGSGWSDVNSQVKSEVFAQNGSGSARANLIVSLLTTTRCTSGEHTYRSVVTSTMRTNHGEQYPSSISPSMTFACKK